MSRQLPDPVLRIIGILIMTFVIITLWAVFQNPPDYYSIIPVFVFSTLMSMMTMVGILVFFYPWIKTVIRNEIERITEVYDD